MEIKLNNLKLYPLVTPCWCIKYHMQTHK